MGGTPMLTYAYNFLPRQDNGPTPFERLLRRDRVIVGIALLIHLCSWRKPSGGISCRVQSAPVLSSEVGC